MRTNFCVLQNYLFVPDHMAEYHVPLYPEPEAQVTAKYPQPLVVAIYKPTGHRQMENTKMWYEYKYCGVRVL